MQSEDTLYEVLEISPRASTEVVKAAYRCLAQVHHPDKHLADDNGAYTHKLTQINKAYSILSDPVARLVYDHKMGFYSQPADRRGGPKAAGGTHTSSAATPSASRPFGFRPI